MKKIKTLIFHPALAPYRVDLFNALSDHVDLKIIFLRENLLNQSFDQESLRRQLKCKYSFLKNGFDFRERSIRFGIKKIIREYSPDVVVSMEYSLITLWIIFLRYLNFGNKKFGLTVWTADNITICNHTNFLRKIARSIVLKYLDSLIVYSEPVKNCYIDLGLESNQIFICRNIQHESSIERKKIGCLKQINLKKNIYNKLINKKVILFVGRLVPIKGVDRLVQAFAQIVKKNPEAILVIVGDGSEKRKLINLTKKLNIEEIVLFLGRLEGTDLFSIYLLSDLFVLPSLYEAYGAVVNEALLFGVPVLCSTYAGASELIRKGINGDIFNPLDISKLQALINVWMTKVNLESKDKTILTRTNLMPEKFDNSVDEFVKAIKKARGAFPVCPTCYRNNIL